MDSLEHRAIGKVSARLVPFLIVCYTGGLLSLAAVGFIAMIIVLALRDDHSLERHAVAPGLPSGDHVV